MPSAITVSLEHPGVLLGVTQIDVEIDGEVRASMQFGETLGIETPAGSHLVSVVLRAVINRRSKAVHVVVPERGHVVVNGTYSRWWGNIKLKTAS